MSANNFTSDPPIQSNLDPNTKVL